MTASPDTLPHSLDAERATLGALMLGGSLTAPLTPAHFFSPLHRDVYAAIERLQARGAGVDQVTVAAELNGSLEKLGGKLGLLEMCDAALTAANADTYAGIVLENAKLRAVVLATDAARRAALDNHAHAERIVADTMSALLAVESSGTSASGESAGAAVSRRLEEYRHATARLIFAGSSTAIHRGDTGVLGGRPGHGKTAYMIHAADGMSRNGHRVAIFSYEMNVSEIADRLVMRATGSPLAAAYDGLAERELEAYRRACEEIATRDNLELYGCAGWSEAKLAAAVRAFAARGGEIAFVDYVQIAVERRGEENSDLTRFMRHVQQLGKSSNVAIVLLSQYSRQAADGKPSLHHLRGSGSLEQEAALVGLLWQPPSDDQEERKRELSRSGYLVDPTGGGTLTKLLWRKVRHGSQREDSYLFDGSAMSFEAIERRPL